MPAPRFPIPGLPLCPPIAHEPPSEARPLGAPLGRLLAAHKPHLRHAPQARPLPAHSRMPPAPSPPLFPYGRARLPAPTPPLIPSDRARFPQPAPHPLRSRTAPPTRPSSPPIAHGSPPPSPRALPSGRAWPPARGPQPSLVPPAHDLPQALPVPLVYDLEPKPVPHPSDGAWLSAPRSPTIRPGNGLPLPRLASYDSRPKPAPSPREAPCGGRAKRGAGAACRGGTRGAGH